MLYVLPIVRLRYVYCLYVLSTVVLYVLPMVYSSMFRDLVSAGPNDAAIIFSINSYKSDQI
jgi:hypothetical protein